MYIDGGTINLFETKTNETNSILNYRKLEIQNFKIMKSKILVLLKRFENNVCFLDKPFNDL
jgi:hypothetical protein